jgi:antitoxin component YwqK of YwqJK toxin-antitoxin module
MRIIVPIVFVIMQLLGSMAFSQERVPVITYFGDDYSRIKEIYFIIEGDSAILDGPFKRFYPNGKLALEVMYMEGLKQGLLKEYYEDGESFQRVSFFKNDTVQGPFKVYYPDGEIMQEGEFLSGFLEGEVKSYFPDGKLKTLGYFKQSIPDSIAVEYSKTGSVLMEIAYAEGLVHGKKNLYYESGQVKNSFQYKLGKMEGNFEAFFESGEIQIKGQYRNDKPVGVWNYFNKAGEIINRENYPNR